VRCTCMLSKVMWRVCQEEEEEEQEEQEEQEEEEEEEEGSPAATLAQ
jgi:hypothetical protein